MILQLPYINLKIHHDYGILGILSVILKGVLGVSGFG